MPALILFEIIMGFKLTSYQGTGNLMTGGNFKKERGFLPTFRDGIGTAWMEVATGWRVNGAAYFALKLGGFSGFTRRGLRYGRKERFGIWMQGVIEYLLRLTHFHYSAQVHHGNVGGYVLEHG